MQDTSALMSQNEKDKHQLEIDGRNDNDGFGLDDHKG